MGICQSVTDVTTNEKSHTTKSNPTNKIQKNKKYKKKSIPKSLKKQVWDNWIGKDIGATKCLCCNHEQIRQIEFHCGHIVAEKNGGKTIVSNLKPICAQCNLSMGIMNMIDFQKKFFTK